MSANLKELGVIKVAKPCHRDWEKMTGDERARFCADCKLTVYDLSAMTTDEARDLIREKEGQLCVRFYQRKDGTVLTRDCPVGVAAYRRRLVAVGVAAASMSVLGLAAVLDEVFYGAASEPAPIPWPNPTQAAAPAKACDQVAEPKPPDDAWIEQRRSNYSTPEHERHVMMGKMIRIDLPAAQPAKKR